MTITSISIFCGSYHTAIYFDFQENSKCIKFKAIFFVK